MFSIAAAEDAWPSFRFDNTSFVGEWLGSQSSVFVYSNFTNGKTFKWSQTGPQVDIVRVQLMNPAGPPILLWCPSDIACERSQGFNGSYWHAFELAGETRFS